MISLLDKKDCNQEKMPVRVASNSSWAPVQPPAGDSHPKTCSKNHRISHSRSGSRSSSSSYTKIVESHIGQRTDVKASWTDDVILQSYIVFQAFITGSVVFWCRWSLQTKFFCNFWCCHCRCCLTIPPALSLSHRGGGGAPAPVPLLLASKRRVIL